MIQLCTTISSARDGSQGTWAVQGHPLLVANFARSGAPRWTVLPFFTTERAPHHRMPAHFSAVKVQRWLTEMGFISVCHGLQRSGSQVYFPTRTQALDSLELAFAITPPPWLSEE